MNDNLSKPSQRVRDEFVRAVENSVKHCKRSLLDIISYAQSQHKGNPEMVRTLDLVTKRVHNDVSLIRDQVLSVFQVYENDGDIPAFGRSEEERATGGR